MKDFLIILFLLVAIIAYMVAVFELATYAPVQERLNIIPSNCAVETYRVGVLQYGPCEYI